jgi:hypothetical protein
MLQLVFTIYVVLGLPKRNKDLIAYVNAIIAKMTGNVNFPTPTPTLAAISAALAAFVTAEAAMGVSKGVKGDRTTKRTELVALLKHLRDYVQQICESNMANAAAIAESAGMRLKDLTIPVKEAFTVTQGLLSGSVDCEVRAPGIPTTYYWSFSVDQKIWSNAPDSMTAKVTITGLTPGQLYYFRYRTMTRKGTSDFSQYVSLLVK